MKIRKAELIDAGGIAKVHVDSWRNIKVFMRRAE